MPSDLPPATPFAPGVMIPYVDPIPFAEAVPLSEENFQLVAGFTCGRPGQPENRFERDVSQWLTDPGRGGAREAARLGLAEVRLYLHTDKRLIGFAAIGPETWDLNGTPSPIWWLFYYGVHSYFRHQPGIVRAASYGRRILGGLIEEIDRRGTYPLFGLYVDPENAARALYEEFGFKTFDTWHNPDDGRSWVRMLRAVTVRKS